MFVAFEGVDGCGKGTQVERLAKALPFLKPMKMPERRTPIGRLIDRYLKGEVALGEARVFGEMPACDPKENALALQALMLANKTEMQADIKDALQRQGGVVMDRYIASAAAYGGADGLSVSYLIEAHAHLIQPDLTFLLDVTPDVTMKRIEGRVGDDSYGRVRERIEVARSIYVALAERDPQRWVILDGEKTPDQVEAWVHYALFTRGFANCHEPLSDEASKPHGA